MVGWLVIDFLISIVSERKHTSLLSRNCFIRHVNMTILLYDLKGVSSNMIPALFIDEEMYGKNVFQSMFHCAVLSIPPEEFNFL